MDVTCNSSLLDACWIEMAWHTHAAHATWLQDKNKDFVVAEHASLMSSSSHPCIAQLFYETPEPGVLLPACFYACPLLRVC